VTALVRLQKFLADAGVASRRAAEQMIVAGRISINGATVRELGTKVDPDHDAVIFDGRRVRVRRKIHLALNKPPGYVCTRDDENHRRTIFDLLPKEWGHLHSVGRLDKDSEGLIFLTNDGQFSLRLTHPRYGVQKVYQVIIEGRVGSALLERFVRGMRLGGEWLKADSARLLSVNNSHSVVEMTLTEGKNREIRRLFESEQMIVSRLQRVRIGPIKLGELPLARWRTLTESEIKSLLGPQ
jgi:23S rRNA pseudouridine2605 synthase